MKGEDRTHLPDFIVRLRNDVTLVVEIKGGGGEIHNPDAVPAKSAASTQWCAAVTNALARMKLEYRFAMRTMPWRSNPSYGRNCRRAAPVCSRCPTRLSIAPQESPAENSFLSFHCGVSQREHGGGGIRFVWRIARL